MASKIIEKQLRELREDHSTSFTAEPIVFKEGGFHLKARIKGPTHSPYEGGVFIVDIRFSTDYPWKPPKVYFETKIYHPSINSASGRICLAILDKWEPRHTISKVLHSICFVLEEPLVDMVTEPEIYHLYRSNRPLYEQTAREWKLMKWHRLLLMTLQLLRRCNDMTS